VIDAQPPKRMRPAAADAANGPRVDQLARTIDPTNNPKPAELQAPDDAGESDLAFFRRRPHVNVRTRLPFENEFPPGVIDADRVAFVHVVTIRDPLTNEPTTRGRGIFYADSSDGGSA
jgi:hypothetical protein